MKSGHFNLLRTESVETCILRNSQREALGASGCLPRIRITSRVHEFLEFLVRNFMLIDPKVL